MPASVAASTGSLLLVAAAAVAVLLGARAALWFGIGRMSWRMRPGRILPIAAALLVVLFGGLTAAMLATGWLTRFDEAINAWFTPYRVPFVLDGFLWVTTLGTGAALVGVALTASLFLWVQRQRRAALALWIGFLGSQATTWVGKYAIGRPRPVFLEHVATAVSPSFPSGHATGVAAVLGFIAYAASRGLPGQRQRFETVYWAGVLVALVGFSRVFLNVHYTTDVVSGFLVGGFWLMIAIALAERCRT